MKKISICLLKYDMTEKSGGDRVVANLANELSEYFEVHLVSINGREEKPYFPVKNTVIYAPLLHGHERIRKTLLKGSKALKKYIKEHKIDIIMSIGGNVNFFMWYAARRNGTKQVFCEHINLISALEDKSNAILRWLGAKTADKIITLTEKDKQSYIEYFKIDEKRIDSIPNWIDPSLLENRTSYDITSKKIITVGRLCEQKGLDYLVEVAKTVFENHKDWQWDIWGDGPDREKIEALIIENGLSDNLHLRGTTNSIYSVYSEYAIYAMTSRSEGLPMVLLEAKTCSLPIVSFDCLTGPSDIVEDSVSGYLVETFDTAKLANKIIELIENDDLRQSFATHAKDNLVNFKREEIVSRWVDLINTLVSIRW